MRLFVVIPHYFGPSDSANSSAVSGAYLEPLSRIAALNECIVSLHRNFGPYRSRIDGTECEPPAGGAHNVIDIVILAMHDRHVLPQLGLDPGVYSVVYVEGRPTQIPFHAHQLMRERSGQYDFYCLLEHDVAIHDPAFFEKLAWFQQNFGPRALLMPTRVETASTGTPGKVIADPVLGLAGYAPFRREGQLAELKGVWNGHECRFELPTNPHSACHCLTREQLAYWVTQPSFDDRDASWIGPVESAVTLSVGKVFDIYKCIGPDPFFLEVHHFGTQFASINPPKGRRHGEPPLLAIAQNAMRAAHDAGRRDLLPSNLQSWLSEGTVSEQVAHLTRAAAERDGLRAQLSLADHRIATCEAAIDHYKGEVLRLENQVRSLAGEADAGVRKIAGLEVELTHARNELGRQRHSLTWLFRSLAGELSRRLPRLLRRARSPAGSP